MSWGDHEHSEINKRLGIEQCLKEKNMEKKETQRGFSLYEFEDSYKNKWSLQKSSSIEDSIWLGPDKITIKHFIEGIGWTTVNLPNNYIANNRMHLSREQVAELIPILQKFVDTGEI